MKIMLVKNRAIGDSILGLSSLSYLRDILPAGSIINYAIPETMSGLYRYLQIQADNIIPFSLSGVGGMRRFWQALSPHDYDIIYELHQSARGRRFFSVYTQMFRKCRYWAHNHHLQQGDLVYQQGIVKNAIQRDLDGLWSHFLTVVGACPLPLAENYLPRPLLRADSLPADLSLLSPGHQGVRWPRVVLGMEASRRTKMWPFAAFVELIGLLQQQFPQIEFIVPVSRSPLGQEITSLLANGQGPSRFKVWPKKLEVTLDRLAPAIWGFDLYIGADTGIKHLCAAANMPTITLFGPDGPDEWHPYATDRNPYFFITPLSCRTEGQKHFCGKAICASMICLNEISSVDVFNTALKLLNP